MNVDAGIVNLNLIKLLSPHLLPSSGIYHCVGDVTADVSEEPVESNFKVKRISELGAALEVIITLKHKNEHTLWPSFRKLITPTEPSPLFGEVISNFCG
jgi:hypothetical protein